MENEVIMYKGKPYSQKITLNGQVKFNFWERLQLLFGSELKIVQTAYFALPDGEEYTDAVDLELTIKNGILKRFLRLLKLRLEKEERKWVIKNDWVSIYFNKRSSFHFEISPASYFDNRLYIHMQLTMLLIPFVIYFFSGLGLWLIPIVLLMLIFGYVDAYIHLPIRSKWDECDPPCWVKIYLYGEGKFYSSLWYGFFIPKDGMPHSIDLPWALDWYRTSHLLKDDTWDHEYKGMRVDTHTEEYKAKLKTFLYPYTYTLKSGKVQNVNATVTVEEREWRPKWFKWTSLFAHVRKTISVEFDAEVGERAGSWKGGTIGCGYDILPGEEPIDTIKRMEKERKF